MYKTKHAVARPNKYFGAGVGKKTGIRAKEHVKVDPDGLDNLDDFYHISDEETDSVSAISFQANSNNARDTTMRPSMMLYESSKSMVPKATLIRPPIFSDLEQSPDLEEEEGSKLDEVAKDVQPLQIAMGMGSQLPHYGERKSSFKPEEDKNSPFYVSHNGHVYTPAPSVTYETPTPEYEYEEQTSAQETFRLEEVEPQAPESRTRSSTWSRKSSSIKSSTIVTPPGMSIRPLPSKLRSSRISDDKASMSSTIISATNRKTSSTSTIISPGKRRRNGSEESEESDSDFRPVIGNGSVTPSKRRVVEESDDECKTSNGTEQEVFAPRDDDNNENVQYFDEYLPEEGDQNSEEANEGEESSEEKIDEEKNRVKDVEEMEVLLSTAKGKGRAEPKAPNSNNGIKSKSKSTSPLNLKSAKKGTAAKSSSSALPKPSRLKQKPVQDIAVIVKDEFVPNTQDGLLIDDEGKRRSNRNRYAPLEWWRNEHVVYGRRRSGYCPVPVIQEIVRVPKAGNEFKTKRRSFIKKRSASIDANGEEVKESKSKSKTKPNKIKSKPAYARVYDVLEDQEKNTMVAVNPDALEPLPVKNAKFLFRKLFSEGEFMAAGLLELPPGADKPQKNSGNSSMVFTVTDGTVEVFLQGSRFEVTAGGVFFIPRENDYTLFNKTNEDVRMSFVHCTEVVVGLPTSVDNTSHVKARNS